MMMRHFPMAASAVISLMLVFSGGASAQDDNAFIGYRQKVMQSMGSNMGAVGDILKFKLPHQANVAGHAREINEAAHLIPQAFDKRVTDGKTDARSGIWQDMAGFKEKVEALKTESARLAQVAAGGSMEEIAAQVKKLGGACGDCHKEFRKPKEESYKNM
jgi:cytochrome c556